jgi:hypothetical protein
MEIPKIDYEEGDSLERIFKQHKNIVYNRIFDSIKFGIKNKLKEVVVFELGDTEKYLDLTIDNWENSLNNCLKYFVEIEDYEKCLECQEMIKKMKEK